MKRKITFVKEFVTDNGEGFTYLYGVRFDDCTLEEYINVDKQGRTIQKPYCRELLPFSVRKWMDTHDKEFFDKIDDVTVFVYR